MNFNLLFFSSFTTKGIEVLFNKWRDSNRVAHVGSLLFNAANLHYWFCNMNSKKLCALFYVYVVFVLFVSMVMP
jgi:hypothetical protein